MRLGALTVGLAFVGFAVPGSFSTQKSLVFGRPVAFWVRQLDLDPAVRHPGSVEALAAAGAAAFPGVSERLTRGDGVARKALLGVARAWPDLGLRVGPADRARRGAAEVMVRVGAAAEPVAPFLTEALRLAEEPGTVEQVRLALRGLGPASVPHLLPLGSDPVPRTRARGLEVLAEVLRRDGPGAVPVATVVGVAAESLGHASREVVLRALPVLEAVAGDAGDALDSCLALLRHADAEVRAEAATVVGRIGRAPERCVGPLVAGLGDAEERVRVASARALGRFGAAASAACGALGEASLDVSSAVAVASLRSLGRIGDPGEAATAAVVANLAHPQAVRRTAAAQALNGAPGGAGLVVPALIGALGDGDESVRHGAARALARYGPAAAAAVPALTMALWDTTESVRICAAEALGSIGPAAKSAVPVLNAARNNNQSVMSRPVLAALASIERESVLSVR